MAKELIYLEIEHDDSRLEIMKKVRNATASIETVKSTTLLDSENLDPVRVSKFDLLRRWINRYENEKRKKAYIEGRGYSIDFVDWIFQEILEIFHKFFK